MSTALGTNLVSGSIDASLAEVDLRSRDPERAVDSDIVIGPFAVLDFTSSGTLSQEGPLRTDESIESPRAPPAPAMDPVDRILPDITGDIPDLNPASIMDSLSQMDDFLHWSDLLSFSPDQPGLVSHPTLSMPNDMSFDLSNDVGLLPPMPDPQDGIMQISTPQQTSIDLTPTKDVLKDAQFLLKHFQDVVIPQIMAIPFGQKSPWKILNLPAAVVAFGDTTFLGTDGVSHARLSNLYGLLACSALDLALKSCPGRLQPSDHWFQIASQSYQQAKDNIQISLQEETQGPQKAKYKDQLMAANILTQYAVGHILYILQAMLTFQDPIRPTATCALLLN